jgi:gamma-glutamyltranspeptidase / glutathione hydrolase
MHITDHPSYPPSMPRDDPHQTPLVPARVTRGTRGAVASPQYLASEAGLGVLRAGGSAVDAAIATNAALAVVAAHSCGLGGDAFWLIWDGERIHGLNGSGRSAQSATLEAAAAAGLADMPLRGPWTVTLPGAIHSWGEAHARFGRLPWAALLEPAVELATGFAATHGWAAAVERAATIFGTTGDWARTFRPHGRAWHVGERVALPALAATLRRLAADGPATAYAGPLAARAAAYLADRGSPLRATDFATHRSDWTEPISTAYRGLVSVSHPPNSCGPLALEMLGLLERFPPPPPDAFDGRGVADSRWVHLGLEAARLALADRDAYLTDADHMPPDALEQMLHPDRLDRLAASIDPERAANPRPATLPAGGGTVFLATADGNGMLVSLIESNYAGFGSGLVDPETGIGYQNRGAFFRLDPAQPNVLAPAKRTVHTLTPGMLLRDGRPWIAHGQMGGEIQAQVFAQFVSAVVDGGLDIATAIAAPRWSAYMPGHMQPPTLSVLETGYAPDVADYLRRRGHDVSWAPPLSSAMGHAQAIEIVELDGERTLAAASDPRSEGAALGW